MPRRVFGLVALTALLLVALAFAVLEQNHQPGTPVAATALTCRSDGLLPDAACTPGATDGRVTQADIDSTICVGGYTATVRPPSSYTDALKSRQIKEYGYSDTNPADYEEDHLVPLELGGSPTDPRNLWPEPRAGATRKDAVENALHARVCAGTLSLAAAQAAIAKNWQTAG